MLLSQLLSLFLVSRFTPVAAQEFPAKVQVDLIFPKNETYTPTGHFPIVFAVKNFPLAAPLAFDVYGTVKTERAITWQIDDPEFNRDWDIWSFPGRYQGFRRWGESRDVDPMFFIESMSEITNGTDTHFHIAWSVYMDNCTDLDYIENPDKVDNDGNILWRSEDQLLEFSVAPDGKIPDIEEAIRSCGYQSLAIDLKGTGSGSIGSECGDMRNVTPADQCDLLSDYAEEVATNVSIRVLDRFGCEEGTWQEMREDCPDLAARYGPGNGLVVLAVGVVLGVFML